MPGGAARAGEAAQPGRRAAAESHGWGYGIGHTRWATHGRPTEENAHPHRDCHGDIVVVHNGIVENYLALKQQLAAEGQRFVTETDTEIIAHLVEKYYDGNLENAVREAVRKLRGVFALSVISQKRSE